MALEQLRRTISYIFRQAGKDSLDEKEFKLVVSMKLKWFSPGEAKQLLSTARTAGLVDKKGKMYSPMFDIGAEDIPMGFRPDNNVLVMPETPLFSKVVDAIVSATGQERNIIVARINNKQERLGIDVRVVALLVARESGVDIEPFYEETEGHVIATYGMSRGGPREGEEEEE